MPSPSVLRLLPLSRLGCRDSTMQLQLLLTAGRISFSPRSTCNSSTNALGNGKSSVGFSHQEWLSYGCLEPSELWRRNFQHRKWDRQKATVLGDEDDTWHQYIHHPRIIILIILMTLRMTQIPLYGLGLIDSSVPRLRGLSGFIKKKL